MHPHSSISTCSLILLPFILLSGVGVASSDDELLSMVKVIEEHEKTVQSMSFRLRYAAREFRWADNRWDAVADSTPPKPVRGIVSRSTSVVYDIATSRFRADDEVTHMARTADSKNIYTHGVSTYSDNQSEFVILRKELSTPDVADLRASPQSWASSRDAKSFATIDGTANQGIYMENNLDALTLRAEEFGIGWVTPFVSPSFEPPRRLSVLLRQRIAEKVPLMHSVLDNGHWEFKFPTPYGFRVVYSPIAGRVEHAEWGSCLDCPDLEMRPDNWLVRTTAQFDYTAGEDKIPRMVSVIDAIQMKGRFEPQEATGAQWMFFDGVINPSITDDIFEVEFEDGTIVDDHVNQRHYVQGGGLEHDRKAVATFLERHGLLNEADPPIGSDGPTSPASRTRFLLLLINVVAVAAVIAFVAWRRFMHR